MWGSSPLDCTLPARRGACRRRRADAAIIRRRGGRRPMARLVLNHSTHCEGLIPVLRRLASLLPEGSVIPARISVARAAADRSLRVNVTGPGRSRDSFRLLAKRGTVVQEVALPLTLTLTPHPNLSSPRAGAGSLDPDPDPVTPDPDP